MMGFRLAFPTFGADVAFAVVFVAVTRLDISSVIPQRL